MHQIMTAKSTVDLGPAGSAVTKRAREDFLNMPGKLVTEGKDKKNATKEKNADVEGTLKVKKAAKVVEEDDAEQQHELRSNKKAKLGDGKSAKPTSTAKSVGSKKKADKEGESDHHEVDGDEKSTKKRKRDESEKAKNEKGKLKVEEAADGNSPLSKFNICKETVDKLLGAGITCLFPIQAATFNHVYNGKDLIAKARTGTGKTLAFTLPVHEKMLALKAAGEITDKRGRAPACIVMAPTRELAKQIAKVFDTVAAGTFTVLSVYGGTPYAEQVTESTEVEKL
jgi:ATP-dependent RNA helicase DDX21